MRTLMILGALSMLPNCNGDETVRAYGAADKVWRVTEIDGKPFTAHATLTFPEAGKIAGDAPCNSYSATMTVPYPWFEAGPVAVTRRACPQLAAEAAYLAALRDATLSEVLGNTLILSSVKRPLAVFKAVE
tara:strand:- start:119317 stop:119709 length:393 start_codon:yes stop_codon:yes gene_type:complete